VGIVASVSTGVVTFLGPLKQAERDKAACQHLDEAILDYETGVVPGDKDPDSWLNDHLKQARQIVLSRAQVKAKQINP
jgi:hypothetical protein